VPGLAKLLHRDVEIPSQEGPAVERSFLNLAGISIVQLAILGCFYLAGHWMLYPLLWLAPLFTILPTLNRLRTIAEHTPARRPAPGAGDIGACTRTTLGLRLVRALLAPLNFSYHFEHHLLPGVPFHQLPALHRLLAERGYFAEQDEIVSPGYATGLWRLCQKHCAAGAVSEASEISGTIRE